MSSHENMSALGRVVEVKRAKREDVIFNASSIKSAKDLLAIVKRSGGEMPLTQVYVAAYDGLPELSRESIERRGYELVIHHDSPVPGWRKPDALKK